MGSWRIIPLLFLLVACVDKIVFDVPLDDKQLVVDGSITNSPGPYTVMLSIAYNNARPERFRNPVTGAQIDLYENDIKICSYMETEEGTYKTPDNIRGEAGRTYYIKIRTSDSQEYTSEPELLEDAGTFDNIQKEFTTVPYNKYDIFIDAHPHTPQTFLRWTIIGTWRGLSFPERAIMPTENGEIPAPLPCSGVIYDPYRGLVRVDSCTCCECWITEREPSFTVSDSYFLGTAGYSHTNAGVVKVTRRTFFEKYHVEIIQMAITPSAHEFFRQLKAQTEGAGSLFQPSFGEVTGNIKSNNGKKVLGYFWAAGTVRDSFTIEKDELPIEVEPIDTVPEACNYFGESTYTKPPFW